MTDEVQTPAQQQAAFKKDVSGLGGASAKPGGGRGGKRSGTPRSGSAQGSVSGKDANTRPTSRGSNKSNNANSKKAESGLQRSASGNDARRGGRGGKRGSTNTVRQQSSASKDVQAPTAKPAQTEETAGRDVQSIQRLISEMSEMRGEMRNKTSSNGVSPESATAPSSALGAHPTLTANAPVFQPGAVAFPSSKLHEPAPRHRKAASVGTNPAPPLSYSNSYSPNLGSMTEDSEVTGFEEGEISDTANFQQAHHGRSQSQSFTAPRFAALARQEQGDSMGPPGRPQLAPTFTFGARRRGTNPPVIAPAISEEDVNFQFPQQQHQQQLENLSPPQEHRRTTSTGGEITGIMAEQMALQSQIEALQQQQAALYHQQLASNQLLGSTLPGRVGGHRRVQSTLPSPMTSGFSAMGQFGTPMMGLDGQQSAPKGHGRRHSVNVLNKATGPGSSLNYGNPYASEGFDDGFTPPPAMQPAHSRQASRADTSWRMNGGVGPINANPGLTDLAQAQAQLASLQQFRAAAGGHHHKLPSFNFPNMLPNVMAANMMGLGGFNLLQQQQQQFQMALQQQNNAPQRKSLFAPYLPQASLPPLLAAGKLVVGILRVNKRNRSDAYVATEVLDADIYICGSKDRNRALEGDIVAVELLDVDEVWGTKKEKEEKKRKKEENSAYDPRSAAGRKNDKKKDDVEVEGQGLMLFEDEEVTDEVKPQFAGHVVAVVERMPGQLFSGTLGLLRPSSAATKEKQEAERREREGDRGEEQKRGPIERPKIVWFKPTDKRVPLIAIPTEQAPPDFVQNSEAYANKLFVACIKRHPISSLHPFGTLVEELGPIGDIEVETSALLKDCNFPTEEFTDNVLKCLPPTPWTIPEREHEVRTDLRKERVFTIDPDTAKDFDDAVSIKKNEDGTYNVGVHIADVSHFVKPNIALDRDARKRATSVYLVQRAVPMLPPALSEQICSLVPGQERLTFSVIFTMTEDAKVVKKRFEKTIIKSCARLTYADAQNVIDGKPLGSVPVAPEFDAVDIEHDLKILNGLAQKLRSGRSQIGTLRLDSLRLNFTLDENGLPTDTSNYERTDSHKLIEEFMLLTNMAVAQQIAHHLPEQALLRRHEEPIERRLNIFKERAARLGYTFDTSSAGAFMKSFDTIEDKNARVVLQIIAYKALHTAKYFCAGMLDIAKYNHYALNVPLYTHFTSPIRRYADIIVHRQLESIFVNANGGEPKFAMDRDSVAKVAQQCNIKKESAKLAQEQSSHLFLCVLIADLTQRYGPVIRPATVVNVLDAAFDVLVPEFGIEKRVHVDQMPIDNHVFDEHTHTLQIYWSNRDVISWLAENNDDEHLKKVKQSAEQHALKMEVSSRSVNDESALFDEDDADDEIVLGKAQPDEITKETSKQRLISQAKIRPQFEGLKTSPSGHKIQEIRELQTVPVIVTADLTKSPPVIKVYSVNPYAEEQKK
ncbi:CsMn04 [Sanghuangporus baumii]|uniref:DIS3-like exonuclease 2 n=1 Tax=Sanghuangporus baumii TaxID=108892 RepID=A0A9Q5HR97_SANBA|nr:CsMn04 [Sanghuangporus baumii]